MNIRNVRDLWRTEVELDSDLWISNPGLPNVALPYRLFVVVDETLASSKK